MDWNGDGKLDIISGCYRTEDANAGQVQILVGKGGLDFEKARSLTNKAGEPLQNIPIAPDPEEEQLMETICIQQHVVDYDDDGDMDLVVGCFGHSFYYYENLAESNKGENALSETPVKMSIKSISQHSAPHLADWDNDGDLDLLSGTVDGGVLISENVGTRSEPEWSEFKQLVPPPANGLSVQVGGQSEMGVSTRVWAEDINGDGWLDLLVGDQGAHLTPNASLTEEDFAEKEDWFKKEAAASRAFHLKMTEDGVETEPESPQFKEMLERQAKMTEVLEEIYTFQLAGSVWLLLRNPPVPNDSRSGGVVR